ncbi:MAG: transcription-repair coupling factor [Acidobacteria bacterium]|nr:transcription-repair coupling factor [Acidobacteriota bacterium]MBI3654811.1 transcription-repair coupling factor [Acidobacteriota bacterium]
MIRKLFSRFTEHPEFQRSLALIKAGHGVVDVSGLSGGSKGLFVALLNRVLGRPIVFLTSKNQAVDELLNDTRFFLSWLKVDPETVLAFPGFEVDCYRLSPHPEVSEQRAGTLWRLLTTQVNILVAPLESILFRIVAPDDFAQVCKTLKVGEDYPPETLVRTLRAGGFVYEDPVTVIGEFSQRGSIVDFFPHNDEWPLRVEFFGDTIESIRQYNPETQRSIEAVPQVELVPMREWCPTTQQLQWWAEVAGETWPLDEDAKHLRDRINAATSGQTFPAFEFLLPLTEPVRGTLFDYTPDFLFVIDEPESLQATAKSFLKKLQARYSELAALQLPAISPDHLTLTLEEIESHLQHCTRINLRELGTLSPDPSPDILLRTQPVRMYHGMLKDAIADVRKTHENGETALYILSSLGRAERLLDIFTEYDLPMALVPKPSADDACRETAQPFPCPAGAIMATTGNVSRGFAFPEMGLTVYTSVDLFDEAELNLAPRRRKIARSTFFSDFRDLREGDYVVHLDHGIGQFQGLRRIGLGDEVKEFMLITYRDDDKVYVPVENLDLIQKYAQAGEASPTLDKLGGATWVKTKAKIKKSMRDMADELLRLYAERGLAQGHAFSNDGHWQREFEDAFEFEETPDQAGAILEMKEDMEATRPMDRLICGDVGYGKTEVAMRGAFKATIEGKQAAVLTPTTVLAFQHYTTFKSRFAAFPIQIEMLSRFKSKKEQEKILEDLESGKIDIIIGTHRLLSSDVKFHDLGLLIVDEEQRFGVTHKERLKKFKTQIDILTLSATPIPRTLHMAMTGIRDMSIIETPPKDRLAIQTMVVRFDPSVVRSAINLELARNGQVYFVHNRIETIYARASAIQSLCAEARVVVAHGQMREGELEKIMIKFVNHEFDVLVSTTIIENGLDVALANTIIIERADSYGLSELYQLRGRVGRSNRRAYAYLLAPPEDSLTELARKRLAAIREFSDLGSGFRLAAMDLEIRGAGNLLGGEQHGHINAVGFELYNQLLEQAIQERKGERPAVEVKTAINLNLDIRIPEEYIGDAGQRLRAYKRIASVQSAEELVQVKAEIADRFGKYPEALENLFEYAGLRLQSYALRVHSIERQGERVLIKFMPESTVSAENVVRVIARLKGAALSPNGVLTIRPEAGRPPLPQLRRILELLSA